MNNHNVFHFIEIILWRSDNIILVCYPQHFIKKLQSMLSPDDRAKIFINIEVCNWLLVLCLLSY